MSNELNIYIDDLELKLSDETVLSTEDEILVALFKEKGATKEELTNVIKKVPFFMISQNIDNMENEGLIVGKKYFDSNFYYYLTSVGASESEFRFNTNVYFKIYGYLVVDKGYNELNVTKFLRNIFYRFYIDGSWKEENLEDQYIVWCASNELDPKKLANGSLKSYILWCKENGLEVIKPYSRSLKKKAK